MSNKPEFLQEVLEPALQRTRVVTTHTPDPESMDGSFTVKYTCDKCGPVPSKDHVCGE